MGILEVVAMPAFLLIAAGFETSGISNDSYASKMQSDIGNVKAGSVFACLMSCGMTCSIFNAAVLGTCVAFIGLYCEVSGY